MRIAQVAPLAESCPPKLYGGTERVAHFLTEELVKQGHDVTLFASGDSVTSARLVSCVPRALRLSSDVRDFTPYHVAMVEKVRQRLKDFDIVHFHIDMFHCPAIRTWSCPTLTTLHGRLDMPDLFPFYEVFRDVPLISISNDQRRPLPPVNWVDTVYHGLPPQLLPFNPHGGDYLVFLGRISPEKRPDRAIEIAVRSGLPLKIAAKIDRVDLDYWHGTIEPMVKAHPNIEYIGEVDEAGKAQLVGNAAALLFPIDWPEPFGLVMIEAMACGTPVIAWRNGSVPEVMDDGVTGRVVTTTEEAVHAIYEVLRLDRAVVRARFEERFTVTRMANDYVRLYEQLIKGSFLPGPPLERMAVPAVPLLDAA
ncbi:glycosyltransferase family 4 protein [Novosphingobium profundi]|uniref:glycosyltransferase family 4 protein n=1 Tax=Novosphingobium profundi TaxID=1774954 RepID=UPI001BD94758|nr:glycosyltransferase family 4 protein [Novosphingobium profundi]MBT0667598.1 glycosyltransferase family 4 protein [Novosphingobium profundi]